jgi:cell division protein FtsI (penicillin-binding protein 3)
MLNERDALMNPEPSANPQSDARSTRISWILRIGTLVGLAIVVGRVIQLQVAPGEQLEGFVAARQTSETLKSVRGDLLDRRGRVLATTRIGYRVIIDPVGLHNAMGKDPAAIDRLIVSLGEVIEMPIGDIADRIITRLVRNEKIRMASREQTDSQGAKSAGGLGLATIGSGDQPAPRTMKLSRYLPMGEPMDQTKTQQMRELMKDNTLVGVTLEHTAMRVQASEALVGSMVGKYAFAPGATQRTGVMGAEKLFEARLVGEDGSKTYVRDDKGRPLWVQRGAWVESAKGQDVRLSIDLEIQRMVHEQLVRGVEDADAAGGRAIVLNPNTGEILAITDVLREIPNLATVDWWDPKSGEPRPTMPAEKDQPRYKVLRDDPNRAKNPAMAINRCLEEVYEPGSTLKPFAWTLAKSNGLLPDDEQLNIRKKSIRTNYGRVISDAYTHDDLDGWDDVLRYSSNIGMSIATARLSHDQLRGMVNALGFGQQTGIGLGGEASGLVTSKENWSDFSQTSVGMGYEIAVTPIQMVRAFSVFARHGEMAGTLPEVRLTAAGDRNKPGMIGDATIVERVFSAASAKRTIGPMREVAEKMDEKKRQQYPDDPTPMYSMFGKSGTSHIAMVPPAEFAGFRAPKSKLAYFPKQHHSSFIVAAPADAPEIVVLVVIDDIGPERVTQNHHYGSWVAGPVVRRVVDDVLPYLGVEPDVGMKQAVSVR